MKPNAPHSPAIPPSASSALGVALFALALLAAPQADARQAPAADGDLLAGVAALSDTELAAQRGGFFTADGLKMDFGFRLKLDIDDRLQLETRLDPLDKPFGHEKDKPSLGFKHGELKLTLKDHGSKGHGHGAAGGPQDAVVDHVAKVADEVPVAGLGLAGDGAVEILAGTPKVTETAGGKRYQFDDKVTAEVVKTPEHVTLTTTGDLPVKVVQRASGLDLEVGEKNGTKIVDRISPRLVGARVTNRRDGVRIDHNVILDVSLLNFSELGASRSLLAKGRRLQRLLNRGIVNYITPR